VRILRRCVLYQNGLACPASECPCVLMSSPHACYSGHAVFIPAHRQCATQILDLAVQVRLLQQAKILGALKEIKSQEEDISFLDPETAALLKNADQVWSYRPGPLHLSRACSPRATVTISPFFDSPLCSLLSLIVCAGDIRHRFAHSAIVLGSVFARSYRRPASYVPRCVHVLLCSHFHVTIGVPVLPLHHRCAHAPTSLDAFPASG
jgi:hypothetical protein